MLVHLRVANRVRKWSHENRNFCLHSVCPSNVTCPANILVQDARSTPCPWKFLSASCLLYFHIFCEQALSQKEVEKAALMEKVAALQQDLAAEGMELECMQREAMSKQEQDKVKYGRVKMVLVIFLFFFFTYNSLFQHAMAVCQTELQDLRNQFEESLNSHEDVKKSLTEQVRELNQQRDHTQQEVSSL